jgi:hypothetical protein
MYITCIKLCKYQSILLFNATYLVDFETTNISFFNESAKIHTEASNAALNIMICDFILSMSYFDTFLWKTLKKILNCLYDIVK